MTIKDTLMDMTRQVVRNQRQASENKRMTTNGPFLAGRASPQTIAAGSIAVTRPHVVVLPESGIADNLDEITNFADGKFVIVATLDPAHTITVRDESVSGGNIRLSGGATSYALESPEDTLLFIYKEELGLWVQTGGLVSGGVPGAHAASHQHGGSDEVATATPANNAIPKANGSGKLANGWLNTGAGNGLDADLLDGQQGSHYLDRTNHTGTQLAATISDFDTQVRTNRLDQMAAPTASVSMNSQLLTNVADPSGAQDAATKAYVDAVAVGLDVKASVRAATTADITLSGAQTIDGVSVIAGDRVLVKNQSTGSQNGIYVAAAGAWARAADADTSAEVTSGMFTFVTEGTANGNVGYVLTTDDPITLGTTALVFSAFSGPTNVAAAIDGSTEQTVLGTTDKFALVVSGVLRWASYDTLKTALTTLFNTLFVRQDGTTPLSGNWDIGEDRRILAEALQARDGEGLRLEDDAGNVALAILDEGNQIIVGDSTVPTPFAGFNSTDYTMVIVRQPVSTSAPTPLAGFLFMNNQTGTGANSRIGQLMFANEAIGVAEKRVAQIIVDVEGDIRDGKIILRTFKAGSSVNNLILEASGLATFVKYFNWAGQKRVSAQFDKTDTTLATVTGLSVDVEAGKSYYFYATLFVNASAAGGMKVAMAGTATATAIIYHVMVYNSINSIDISSRQTAMGGAAGVANDTVYLCTIQGTITVNAAGTLLVQFAQNASSGTSSVLVGSTFVVQQMV